MATSSDTTVQSTAAAATPSSSFRVAMYVRRRFLTYTAIRRVIVPAAIVAAWILVSHARLIGSTFLPSPADLWNSFQSMRPELGSSIESSVTMTLLGFLLGTSFGITMGLAMAYSRIVRELFGGLLDFIRPVPVFALIPLFVLWFGIGKTPQITLIALGTSIILGVTTIEAIRNVAPVHIKAALTLGASRRRIYLTVILPSIFPHLLGAIRVAGAASWGLDVAAEFIGAQNGLGYLMIVREQYLDTSGIILVVIIYALLALGLDFLIRSAEHPLTRWTERRTGTGVVASIVGLA